MSCARICRELLELSRFGALDVRSAPHIEHLVDCRGCRDEIGLDRALVQQLRVALQARIEGAAPSSAAWDGILRRTQGPEVGLAAWFRRRSGVVLTRLRTATAVSATALAVLIASGTQVGIQQHPAPSPRAASAAGERFERQPLLAQARDGYLKIAASETAVAYVPPARSSDPEAFMIHPSNLALGTGGPAPGSPGQTGPEPDAHIVLIHASISADQADSTERATADTTAAPWQPISKPTGKPS
ncbi:MAG: hypothetical protein M3O77_02725 [Chloroflexota bacterium]|nr:hypothetical protein [Chloroflexota bacterium]